MPGIESGSLSSKKHLGTKGFLGRPAEYRLNKSNSFPSVIRAYQSCQCVFCISISNIKFCSRVFEGKNTEEGSNI